MEVSQISASSYNSPLANVGRAVRETPATNEQLSPAATASQPAPPAPPAAPPVLNNAISATSQALQSQLLDRQREAAREAATQPAGSTSSRPEEPGFSPQTSASQPQATPTQASNQSPRDNTATDDRRFSGNPARQAVAQYQANQSLLQDAGPSVSASA